MFLRSAKFYSLSQVLMAALSFLRNVILARALSVEDFGIAATFSLVMTLIESTSTLALDKYIVKSRFGANKRVLNTLHSLTLIRGGVMALALYFASSYVAEMFQLGHIVWIYQALAFIPFIRGGLNLGGAVQQKNQNFISLSMIDLSSQVVGTIALVYVLTFWNDYKAALVANILIAVMAVITSHVLSESKYRLGFNIPLMIDVLKFSWPLLVSGLLIFFVLQGERTIVGVYYSLQELALFTVVFGLISMPVMILNKIFLSVYLPRYATEYRDGDDGFGIQYDNSLISMLMISIAFFVFFGFLGEPVITLIYGSEYEPDRTVFFLLLLSMTIRLVRTPVAVLSLATGNSPITLYMNLIRVASIIPAIAFALSGQALAVIILCSVIGESLSYLLGYQLARGYISNTRTKKYTLAFLLHIIILSLSSFYFMTKVEGLLQTMVVMFCHVGIFLLPIIIMFSKNISSFYRSVVKL